MLGPCQDIVKIEGHKGPNLHRLDDLKYHRSCLNLSLVSKETLQFFKGKYIFSFLGTNTCHLHMEDSGVSMYPFSSQLLMLGFYVVTSNWSTY
jgi:hypothetical protein